MIANGTSHLLFSEAMTKRMTETSFGAMLLPRQSTDLPQTAIAQELT